MVLQASGAISLEDIRAEFSGPASPNLQAYYRGGGLVPDIAANSGVPTSGAISLQDFYGAQAFSASLSGFFSSLFDVSRSSVQTSLEAVTVNISSGTLTASLSGSGGSLRMSVNGGPYLLGSQTVSNGNTIRLRQTSSNSFSTSTTCTVSLGGFDSKTFTVTTEDAP